jgi:hypothetical protein
MQAPPASPSSTTRFDVHYDDNHWDDPRPDLAAGQPTWAAVLKAAWQLDGDEQDGCFGVLHGLRGRAPRSNRWRRRNGRGRSSVPCPGGSWRAGRSTPRSGRHGRGSGSTRYRRG